MLGWIARAILAFALTVQSIAAQNRQLPSYGNLHPLNFGEMHCGPDLSRYHHEMVKPGQETQQPPTRRLSVAHILSRHRRWATGWHCELKFRPERLAIIVRCFGHPSDCEPLLFHSVFSCP